MLNRRDFLKWSLAGGAALAGAQSWAQSQPAERRLKVYNNHTRAQLSPPHTGAAPARDSLPTHGQAIDIRLSGVALADLHRAALGLRAGGVGNYPTSNFIHLDTGRV